MAGYTSNIVKASPSLPFQNGFSSGSGLRNSALQNKAYSTDYSSLGLGKGLSVSGGNLSSQLPKALGGGVAPIDPTKVNTPITGTQNPTQTNTGATNTASNTTSNTNGGLYPQPTGGITTQQVNSFTDAYKKQNTTTPQTQDMSYGGLISSALGKQNELAKFKQEEKQTQANIAAEPNYMKGYQTQVQANTANVMTAQEQEKATEASNALQAAGLVAPRQNGYAMINPVDGSLQGGGNAITKGAQMDAQYQGALANATDYQAIGGAQTATNSLTQLIQNAKLNDSSINAANASYQTLQQNMSNSDFLTLNNTLQSIDEALYKVSGQHLLDSSHLTSAQGTSIVTTINNAIKTAQAMADAKVPNNQSNQGASNSGNSSGTLTWDNI